MPLQPCFHRSAARMHPTSQSPEQASVATYVPHTLFSSNSGHRLTRSWCAAVREECSHFKRRVPEVDYGRVEEDARSKQEILPIRVPPDAGQRRCFGWLRWPGSPRVRANPPSARALVWPKLNPAYVRRFTIRRRPSPHPGDASHPSRRQPVQADPDGPGDIERACTSGTSS
jgi:hypothetical protein